MKRSIVPVIFCTALFSGCATVYPYEPPYDVYATAPAYTNSYAVAPTYAVPAPYYPPVYVGPPVYFNFSLRYWSGGGHRHHWHHPGFGGHGFAGRRGGWGWRR